MRLIIREHFVLRIFRDITNGRGEFYLLCSKRRLKCFFNATTIFVELTIRKKKKHRESFRLLYSDKLIQQFSTILIPKNRGNFIFRNIGLGIYS